MNNLPETVTRQRRVCDLNPGPSVPESSTLTTRLPSHSMAAYHRVYDSRQLHADWKESGSAPEPYARQSCMGYLYHFSCNTRGYVVTTGILVSCDSCSSLRDAATAGIGVFSDNYSSLRDAIYSYSSRGDVDTTGIGVSSSSFSSLGEFKAAFIGVMYRSELLGILTNFKKLFKIRIFTNFKTICHQLSDYSGGDGCGGIFYHRFVDQVRQRKKV